MQIIVWLFVDCRSVTIIQFFVVEDFLKLIFTNNYNLFRNVNVEHKIQITLGATRSLNVFFLRAMRAESRRPWVKHFLKDLWQKIALAQTVYCVEHYALGLWVAALNWLCGLSMDSSIFRPSFNLPHSSSPRAEWKSYAIPINQFCRRSTFLHLYVSQSSIAMLQPLAVSLVQCVSRGDNRIEALAADIPGRWASVYAAKRHRIWQLMFSLIHGVRLVAQALRVSRRHEFLMEWPFRVPNIQ